MRLIRTAYSVVTRESAEVGDFADTGWKDEEGETMEPDALDLEDDLTAVDLAVRFLKDKGVTEASSSRVHAGVWYSAFEDDYRTGDSTESTYHLDDFTPEEQAAIYAQVMNRR